ncbi:MarR family winged helix-turn-helix transcriptional regulator [Paraburkholderia sp. BL23I1N1]|uniref:MarR family winged helix-turn-helix transcriptional regulator n=1 Tax=Paraburkholderia sp. BL23I1N1 TaxID=1938802 RepID=UPI001601B0FF|nr:MarR family transcriptional regulator [Paraburkholderia sp. BL23I1N1]
MVLTSPKVSHAEGVEPATFVIGESVAHVAVVTARLFDRALADKLRRHNVPIGQWPFLLFLWADETLTQRDLSRLMAIEEATVTSTIDRMVRDGLLLRERASHDLRKNRLKLTARGQQLKQVLLPEARAVVQRATRGLSKAEIYFLLTLLRKVEANLVDENVTPLDGRESE